MWFTTELRVRYQETDRMGVVYHANYLTWFEVGRTEMMRSHGMPYEKLEERGLLLPVTDADAKFRKPAKYDDQIVIYTRVASFNHLRLRFEYEVKRGDELLVTGSTSHAWLNGNWRPTRIDREAADVYALLQKLETLV